MKDIIKKTILILIIMLMPAFCFADSSYTKMNVYSGKKLISSDAWFFCGTPYISLETLKEYGDCSNITISESSYKIYIDISRQNIFIADAKTTDYIKENGGTAYIYIKLIEGKLYVPLNSIAPFTGISYENNDISVNLTPTLVQSENYVKVKTDCSACSSLFESGVSTMLSAGQRLIFIQDYDFICKLRTLSGETVYTEISNIEHISSDEISSGFTYSAKQCRDYSGRKINFVWHSMAGTTLTPPSERGIDVVSPNWCRQIVDGGGSVTNYCNRGYVDICHKNGYEVWLTVNNNMTATGSTDFTSRMLADTSLKQTVIAQFLFYAALYDVDGINVDYEELRDADRDNFTAFIEEFSTLAKKMGLSFAVSLPPVADYYKEYDYQALGSCCDFITLMSYDEHVSTVGSVASFGFVKNSVSKLCSYVSSEKILLGIPFYTRIWVTDSSGSLKSRAAYKMEGARNKLNQLGIVPEWNSNARQYRFDVSIGGLRYRAWLESKRSVANKLTLVYTYNLGGSCCWEYTQAEDGIYETFYDVFHLGADPDTITDPY